MSARNHRTGRDKGNVEIMTAAVEGVRAGETAVEIATRCGASVTQMREAFVIVREAPDLVGQVLDGTMTIFRAHQIVKKGEMHPCPVCEGRGYVFRRRR